MEKAIRQIEDKASVSPEVAHYIVTAFREIIEMDRLGQLSDKKAMAVLQIARPGRRPLQMHPAEKRARALFHVDLVQEELNTSDQEHPNDDTFQAVADKITDLEPEAERPDSYGFQPMPGHSREQIKRDWYDYKKGFFEDEYICSQNLEELNFRVTPPPAHC